MTAPKSILSIYWKTKYDNFKKELDAYPFSLEDIINADWQDITPEMAKAIIYLARDKKPISEVTLPENIESEMQMLVMSVVAIHDFHNTSMKYITGEVTNATS